MMAYFLVLMVAYIQNVLYKHSLIAKSSTIYIVEKATKYANEFQMFNLDKRNLKIFDVKKSPTKYAYWFFWCRRWSIQLLHISLLYLAYRQIFEMDFSFFIVGSVFIFYFVIVLCFNVMSSCDNYVSFNFHVFFFWLNFATK